MLKQLGVTAIVVACLLAAACSGGSGDSPELPSRTPDAFDHDILTAIALQQDEVGELPIASAEFATDDGGVVYTVTYGDDSFRVQSTIARKPDAISREAYLAQLRTAATTIVENEQNLELEGAELAFVYAGRKLNTVTASVVALRGDFVQYVAVSSSDLNRSDEVFDPIALRRYAELVNGRIQQAVEDPESLTPPATAPTFAGN